MENIKKKLQRLIVFIDILKIIEIIIVIAFGFYRLYIKFSILLTAYKILYIVLALLIVGVVILINDSLSCSLKGFFIIIQNNYEDIEERKVREKERKTEKKVKSSNGGTTKKKSTSKKKTIINDETKENN